MLKVRLPRLTRKPRAVRRFDGAATRRRWSNTPTFDNINAETLAWSRARAQARRVLRPRQQVG